MTKLLSPCGMPLRNIQYANKGTSVREKIKEPTNAVVTESAMG